MRKIISFLALLVIAFALPHRAVAWDYSGGTNPSKIQINFTGGNSGSLLLQYDGSNPEYSWSGEFTTAQHWVDFTVQVWNQAQDYNKVYGEHIGATSESTWVLCNDNKEGSTFYNSGLTAKKTYIFQLKDNGDSNHEGFYFRIVPKPESTL